MISYLQRLDLFQAFRRFPVPSAMAIITTLLAITLISVDGDIGSEMAAVVSAMIVGYFLFLGGIIARLIRESQQSKTTEYVSLGFCGVLGAIIFIVLPQDYDLLNTKLFRLPFFLLGVSAVMHLVIAYVPFISKGSDGDFWEYNRKVFIRIVESGFFSGVLYLASLLALVALDKLFDIDFDGRIYGYVGVSIFGIFNSIYFLSKFPALDYDDHVERPLSAFLVFTQFLLIPITVIYMVILHAYGIKILLDGELPRGWIGNLSLWFSVIGVFTYLLNYLNPRFSKRVFVSQFIRYFWLVLIVPAILLMISLFRRINDYGVTEERYALAMIASWLVMVILLYGILRWRALKWLPISLSVVIAFGLFSGPLSIFGATLSSQKQRLNDMMTTAGLIGEGERELGLNQSDILNQLRYLDDRSDMMFINDWIDSPIGFRDESVKLDTTNNQRVVYRYGLRYDAFSGEYFSIGSGGDFTTSIEEYRLLRSFRIHHDQLNEHREAAHIIDGQLFINVDGDSYAVSLKDSVMIWMVEDDPRDQPYRLPVSLGTDLGDIYFSQLQGEKHGIDSIKINQASGLLLIR
jgi:hypothetical protein